jgi:hypothetical protein
MPYAVIRKKKRLANPGKRRKMSRKQIAIFGTKRQKAALRRKQSNPAKLTRRKPKCGQYLACKQNPGRKSNPRRRRNISIRKRRKQLRKIGVSSNYISATTKRLRSKARGRKRRKNVGSILVASIPGMNPGRKRRKKNSMAKRRRRHNVAPRHYSRRRRHYSARRRRHNPGVRTRTIVKYRTRARRRSRGRRSNPISMGGYGADISSVMGVVAGATVNSFAMGTLASMAPTFATGIPGYIASAVIAVLQGQLVGKMFKKPAFGKQMAIGGLTYTAIKVLNDFFPTLPLGLHGLGAIAPSGGFFSPQVNKWGSMGTFQPPGTLLQAVAMSGGGKGMRGLGEPNFSARRVGRIQ